MHNDVGIPSVSIIIPFYYTRAKYLDECIRYCLSLDYPNYEIIVVSNSPVNADYPDVKVVITEKISQGEKNDVGIAMSSGEICAFIGDDVFPRKDWLKNAVKYFKDPEVGAVGGPGVTPENDTLLQKASGVVYSSTFGGGHARFRYIAKKSRYTDDLHATNLLVRKSLLNEVGGFNVRFRSGEDTLLCLKINKKGKKILYAPDVVVYHHRRPLFIPHMRQAKNCGLHRGYYAKRFPETSLGIRYFIPSLFVVMFITFLTLSILSQIFAKFFLLALIGYFILSLASGLLLSRNLKIALLIPIGILLTHLAYGIGFIQGLMTNDERKLMYVN